MGHRRSWLRAITLGVVGALGAAATSTVLLPGSTPARADDSIDGSLDGPIDHVVVYEPDDASGERRAARPERVVARLDTAEVARLEADPAVAHVEPDHRYQLATSTAIPAGAAPRDGDATEAAVQVEPPWGLDRIDQRPSTPLSGTFAPRTGGDGVTVYVVDDGVDPGHPDFGGRVGLGWTSVHDGGGDAECGGHGSHVAGTAAGAEYGVAKQALIVPVRVINCSGWTSLSTLLDALDWILEDHRPGDPAVVNLSIGGPSSAALADALAVLDQRGIVVVAAAGNGATDACTSSPADAPTAIAVGATDASDARAHFSNWGACVDLFAPGVAIRSVGPSSGDQVRNGTSMAAPHVAGAAALVLAEDPTSTPGEVRERLSAGATTGVVTDRGPGSPDRLLHVRPASDAPTTGAPGDGSGVGSDDVASLAPPGTRFVAGVPERVLDTRPVGRVLAGSVVEVPTSTGASGSGPVSAVVLNVTVVDPVA
ncbi:MAG: S8 family serine peptidase, partial [Ilumatobacteraceae bacterium]